MTDCFLCNPDPTLVYLQSPNFFAMTGWGPIVDGYSLIASRAHAPSMLDLSEDDVEELTDVQRLVRARLAVFSHEVVIAEHGRVALCAQAATTAHDPHCLHAHQLCFPGLHELSLGGIDAGAHQPVKFTDWPAAWRGFDHPRAYLASIASDGSTQMLAADRAVPRQLLRSLAVIKRGHGHADWRQQPRVAQARSVAERLRADAQNE